MKSKRAEQIIEKHTNYPHENGSFVEVLCKEMVIKAVELAEEDARERAVKAMCEFIRPFVEERALEKCERECAGCEWRKEFLEYYDNGTFQNS